MARGLSKTPRWVSETPRWAWVLIVLGIAALAGTVPYALRHGGTPQESVSAGAPAVSDAPGTTAPQESVSAGAPAVPDAPGTTAPQPQTLAVLGDGLTAGVGANTPELGFATLTATALGWQVQIHGQVGTGYTNSGAGLGRAVYRERVLPVVNGQPSVVVVQGGLNDTMATADQVQAAATEVFTVLRAGLPRATIVALGPIVTRTTPQLSLTETQRAISSAADTAGIVYVDPTGWLDTNNINLFSQGGNLPSQAGHQVIADRLAERLRTLIPTPAPPATTTSPGLRAPEVGSGDRLEGSLPTPQRREPSPEAGSRESAW